MLLKINCRQIEKTLQKFYIFFLCFFIYKKTLKVFRYAARQAKSSLAPFEFERRAPHDFDVVIDILYCGICHSDIHQVNNEWAGANAFFPMVPGQKIPV